MTDRESPMANCSTCEIGTLHPVQDAEYQTTVAGLTFTATLPGERCDHCQAVYHNLGLLSQVDLLIAHRLIHLGLVNGEVFRFLRKTLGLRAADLAALLDVKAETISRWENGKH